VPSATTKSRVAEILDELTALSGPELDRLLPRIVALRIEKRGLALPKRESELMKTINQVLPVAKRRVYETLRQKLASNTLTEDEQAELLRISDRLEWLGVRRLRALIELASIRKVPVPRLMRQLGIKPAAYAAAA
jgi:hypothetical protein